MTYRWGGATVVVSGNVAGMIVPEPRQPATAAIRTTPTMAAPCNDSILLLIPMISRIIFNNNYPKGFGSVSA
jgi:hypothetical protein